MRAPRGDAVNLEDEIEAAKDANRGERGARRLAALKSSRLALFHFNISSIQTEPLSPSHTLSLSLLAAWLLTSTTCC